MRFRSRIASFAEEHWPEVLLCVISACMLFWRLGAATLEDWDEAIYAEIAREMVQDGDWLTLHRAYEPHFSKPPGLMWTTALFYQLFGVSELWARAASACSGIALVLITYLMGKLLYGKSNGLIASIILLSSYHVVASARFGTTDIMLTAFTCLAVYAYLRVENNSPKWWYLVWISIGLAVMVKSVAGLLVLIAIALAVTCNMRARGNIRSVHFWTGLLIAVFIVAPWHIYMYVLHGQEFLDVYLGRHVIERTFSVLDGNRGGAFFYIERMHDLFFPWCYLAPLGVTFGIWEWGRHRESRVLTILILVVLGVCTVVQTKLPWYIIPLYPALAITIGLVVQSAIRSGSLVAFFGVGVAVVLVGFDAPVQIIVVSACVAIAVVVWCWRGGIPVYRAMTVVMFGFLVAAGLNKIWPLYQRGEKAVERLARIAASTDPSDRDPMISYQVDSPTPAFYSRRPVIQVMNLDDLIKVASQKDVKRILTRKPVLNALGVVYEVEVVAEADSLVYATMKRKSPE